MTYLALARKWRPRSFSELVGQESIRKAMMNSLDQGRLHHAYLFAGTRGVGKTSIARLIAKAMNCEKAVSSTPCLSCQSCLAIEEGRFVDLIEIDAASRTRVEDTRALLDNVHYAPTSGRYKIYLIDEVHMLSQHSFNALLKTLEEPPSHVKFLLATTDPQKLPITVLSRCLQFNLKALDENIIVQQMEKILSEEKLAFEPEALLVIAKAAKGSMRDGLSLLDQAIAMMDKKLILDDVKAMLGFTKRDFALEILQALSQQDAGSMITLSRDIAKEGGQFSYVLSCLLERLHELALIQVLSGQTSLGSKEVSMLSEQFKAEEIQLFYQIALKGFEDLPLAPNPAIGFEMTILRMYTFKPAPKSTRPSLAFEQNSHLKELPQKVETVATISKPEVSPTANIHDNQNQKSPASQEKPEEKETHDWPKLIQQLKLSGLALNALENSEFLNKNQNLISLKVTKGHHALFTPATLKRIEDSLSSYYQEKIQLSFIIDTHVLNTPAKLKQEKQANNQAKAQTALQEDPFFNQISQKFSAELVKNSIEVLKDPL